MIINNLSYRLGLFFFWLMLVIPTTFQLYRGFLLASLFIAAFVHFSYGNWRLHKHIGIIGAICIGASLFFIANGVWKGTPGAIRVGTVFFLWPLLFLFFMGVLNRPDQLLPFLLVLVIGAICASLTGILLVIEELGVFDLGLAGLLENLGDQGAGVGIYDDSIAFRIFNMTTVIYCFPFILGGLLLPKEYTPFRGKWRASAWVGLLLAIVVLILSGRRGFLLTAAVAPFAALSLMKLCYVRIKVINILATAALVVIVGFIVIALFSINLVAIWDNFLWGFAFYDADNLSASVRVEQFYALLEGWLKNPIIGAGHGAAAFGSIQNEQQPWAYELSYLALLFQTGIIGIAIYGSAVGWLYFKCIRVMREQPQSIRMLIPLLSGLACFLIANATNPYLLKFDYLWTLFLPIAVLNSYLVTRNA